MIEIGIALKRTVAVLSAAPDRGLQNTVSANYQPPLRDDSYGSSIGAGSSLHITFRKLHEISLIESIERYCGVALCFV